MNDHPDNYERVCCLCQEYRDPIELNPCTRRTFENGAWVKREESMCNYCQENLNEIQDEDESENENQLYETYQRTFDTDYAMSEARKLK